MRARQRGQSHEACISLLNSSPPPSTSHQQLHYIITQRQLPPHSPAPPPAGAEYTAEYTIFPCVLFIILMGAGTPRLPFWWCWSRRGTYTRPPAAQLHVITLAEQPRTRTFPEARVGSTVRSPLCESHSNRTDTDEHVYTDGQADTNCHYVEVSIFGVQYS